MLQDLLNKVGIVRTKSQGDKNSFGEKDFTLSDAITDLACTIQPVRGELAFNIRGTTYTASKQVYCGYRTDITPGDYIEIDSIDYLIISVQDDAGRGNHLKMYVVQV